MSNHQDQLSIFETIEMYNLNHMEAIISKERRDNERQDNDETECVKAHRTYAVDEDDLAIFVEYQIRIQRGWDEFIKPVQAQLDDVQKAIDNAKQGHYIPRHQFQALVDIRGKCLSALRKFHSLRKDLELERNKATNGDIRAMWGRWFQMEDPQEWLDNYLNQQMNSYFTFGGKDEYDPKLVNNPNSQDSRIASADEIFADNHVSELDIMNQWFDDNPSLGRWWDHKLERQMKSECAIQNLLNEQEDGYMDALVASSF